MSKGQEQVHPQAENRRATVLVVDDDDAIRELCAEVLALNGFNVEQAEAAGRALQIISGGCIDIVLTDLNLPGMGGIELLRQMRQDAPEIDVVVMTGYGTIPTAVEAIRLGACDYITKPFNIDDLAALLMRVMERRDVDVEHRLLREQLALHQGVGEMVGASEPMQRLYRVLLKLAPKRHPVLITGESGTGKELIARALHVLGPAAASPFVPVDCGALSPHLIESELFGHVRGAFTGATHDREGLLGAAHQGTLFFDEIAELPFELQTKLLRALQEREFRPVGGNRSVALEARILAATNRDLEAEIEKGTFREELYFRLNVLTVAAPPLRERKSDIPLLAQHFIEHGRSADDPVTGVGAAALKLLLQYDWPGNVRELENYIHRALAVSAGPLIEPRDLPARLRAAPARPTGRGFTQIEKLERSAIAKTLQATGGDRVRAAKLLGIGKTTIYRKLKEYGLYDSGARAQA
jgi:DNA-binding NtrC family response regulator